MYLLLHFCSPLFCYLWFWCRISCWLRIISKHGSENQQKWSYSPLKSRNFFSLTMKNSSSSSLLQLKTWFLSTMFMAMLILQRCNYFTSISIARSFNDFNYWLLHIISRSSQSHMFYKIGFLKNFVQFIRKHLCWTVFFNKLHAWGMQLYQKRDSGTGVFLWIL